VTAIEAVFFDRDGTLIEDVPFNTDPTVVQPRPGAREALLALRRAGIPTAVVSNQSGLARGLLREDDVRRINRRVDELLGPCGPFFICPHGPEDDCACRKPRPGLILDAAQALGVVVHRCAVIGDIGADVEAAAAAGCRAIIVPTAVTLAAEVERAPERAARLDEAVRTLLEGRPS
jgi:histidinol-phosphate phosphatase family protein